MAGQKARDASFFRRYRAATITGLATGLLLLVIYTSSGSMTAGLLAFLIGGWLVFGIAMLVTLLVRRTRSAVVEPAA